MSELLDKAVEFQAALDAREERAAKPWVDRTKSKRKRAVRRVVVWTALIVLVVMVVSMAAYTFITEPWMLLVFPAAFLLCGVMFFFGWLMEDD